MKWPDHTAVAADAMEELGHWPLGQQGQPILGGRDEEWFWDEQPFGDMDASLGFYPVDVQWHRGGHGDGFGGGDDSDGLGDSEEYRVTYHHGAGDNGDTCGDGCSTMPSDVRLRHSGLSSP